MTSTDASLFSFDEGRRPPTLHVDAPVDVRVNGRGEFTAGVRGPVPSREAYGFHRESCRDRHMIEELRAYTVSRSVLRRVRKLGCKVVLLSEPGTGTVYEFRESQFDETVPKRYNPRHGDDPLYYVSVENAYGRYDDHAENVLIRP